MKQYIIKASGKMPDVIQQIKTLQAIYGERATLSDIATITRYTRLLQAEQKQFNGGLTNGNKNH